MILKQPLFLLFINIVLVSCGPKQIVKAPATTNPEAIYVLFRGPKKSLDAASNFVKSVKQQAAEKKIQIHFESSTNTLNSNTLYKNALGQNAEAIILIDQTRQITIDGSTTVGGYFDAKYILLQDDYQWTPLITLKMNLQVQSSVDENSQILLDRFVSIWHQYQKDKILNP